MDWIVISGVPPHDGRYEFDLAGREFTTREWGWVKKHAGYLPLTVADGFAGGDPELFTVFAAIALRRAGKLDTAEVPALIERLGDVGFGAAITLETDTSPEEAEQFPPPTAASSSSNGASSGDAGRTSSENSTPTPPTTGAPASDSSEFDLLRSGS